METGGTEVTSDVLTLPFRVRTRYPDSGWNFRARGTLRRIERGGGAGTRPASSWRNRILEISLIRDGRDRPWHLAFGRIGVRAAAAAGSFDGVAVDRRMGDGLRLGVFAGWAPSWGEMGFGTEDQVGGMTLELEPGRVPGLRMVAAAVGQYHDYTVSREHVVVTTRWRGGRGLTLLQSADVDIRRSWKRKSGESAVRLASIGLTGRWRATRRFTFSAGYDDREPVRTWETRERPDSLFRDAGRRGLRAGVEWRGEAGRRLNVDAAYRKPDDGGIETKSWGVRGRLPAWPVRWLDLNMSARGFKGPLLAGWTPSAGLSHRGHSGWHLRGTTGVYFYTDQVGNDDRSTAWLSGSVEREFGPLWSALLEARGDRGDGGDRLEMVLETRRRF